MGWTGLANGELLSRAPAEFNVFVTADKKLSFQQNVGGFEIAVLVLRARSLRLRDLRRLLPRLREALQNVNPGEVRFIDE